MAPLLNGLQIMAIPSSSPLLCNFKGSPKKKLLKRCSAIYILSMKLIMYDNRCGRWASLRIYKLEVTRDKMKTKRKSRHASRDISIIILESR